MEPRPSPPQAGTSSNQNPPNPKTLLFPPNQQAYLPAAPISGSNDLLSLFNLSSMYDWYVKPYQKPLDQPQPTNPSTSSAPPTGFNGDLKGKGKADALTAPSPAQLDNLAPKRIKMEKSYGHFVADVGGRNSIRKEHVLQDWILDPNFQELQIPDFLKPFSNDVLSKSFTLKPGIFQGFDSSIWVAEEGGPKRKKKKRKQAEMLAGGMTPLAAPQGAIPQQQAQLQQQHQQLNSTHQQPMRHNTTMNAMSHTPPTSTMMTNQPVPSTTMTARNHQTGNTSNRNVQVDQVMNQHRIPPPQLSQPLGYPHPPLSNDVFYGHEDHRKKKRTKIHNNPSSNTNPASNNPNPPSGSASGSSNHQLALQS